jgi:hypothetical protein
MCAILQPIEFCQSSERRNAYAMRERVVVLGWSPIETIDDYLGGSAAGGKSSFVTAPVFVKAGDRFMVRPALHLLRERGEGIRRIVRQRSNEPTSRSYLVRANTGCGSRSVWFRTVIDNAMATAGSIAAGRLPRRSVTYFGVLCKDR